MKVDALAQQQRLGATGHHPRWAIAILGPCDYLDIFEAPDEIVASKVVAVIRSYGHGHTETWTAIPWERFELVLPT